MGISDWATVVIAVTTSVYTIGTLMLWRESLNTRRAISSSLKLTFLIEYFRAKRDEVMGQAELRGETGPFRADRQRWFSMKEKDYLLKLSPTLESMVEELEQQTRSASSGLKGA